MNEPVTAYRQCESCGFALWSAQAVATGLCPECSQYAAAWPALDLEQQLERVLDTNPDSENS